MYARALLPMVYRLSLSALLRVNLRRSFNSVKSIKKSPKRHPHLALLFFSPPVCRQQGGSVRHDPGQGTISEISAVCVLHHAGVLAGETRTAGQGRLFQHRQQQAAQGHHRSLARRGHCEYVVVFNVDRASICCFFCAGSVGVKSTGCILR